MGRRAGSTGNLKILFGIPYLTHCCTYGILKIFFDTDSRTNFYSIGMCALQSFGAKKLKEKKWLN